MSRGSSLCLILTFLSLFLSGIHLLSSPVKIVPYDLVFLFCSLCVLLDFFMGKRLRLSNELISSIVFCLILLIWLTLQALRSPDFTRAASLLAIALRDLGTMILVAILVSKLQQRQESLTRIIFLSSLLIIVMAMPLYLITIHDPSQVVSTPRPGLIYRAGEGLFPHFQGFSNNPIYLASISSMSMIAGLTIKTSTRTSWIFKLIGLMVLLFTLFATFSRGALVTMILGGVVIVSVMYLYRRIRRHFTTKVMVRLFLIVGLAFPALALIRLPGYDSSVLERMIYRFEDARWNSRAENYWGSLLPQIYDRPLIGHGLRAAELTLHGQAVENSYLDILYDQGTIGLLIWASMFVYIFFVGITKLRRDSGMLPWAYMWTIILFAMGYISMQYDPVVWVIYGIIIGWKPREQFDDLKLDTHQTESRVMKLQ